MPTVGGLPNFYNTAAPRTADLNRWVEEILNLIGGAGYKQSAAAWATFAGALSRDNVSTTARIHAAQELEGRSVFILPFEGLDISASGLEMAPLPVDLEAFAISVVPDAGQITGGSLTVKADAREIAKVTLPQARAAKTGVSADLDLVLRRKQYIQLVPVFTGAGAPTLVRYQMWCTAPHVR